MPAKRYKVTLSEEERQKLEQITKNGKSAAAKINHAHILLKADENQEEGGCCQAAEVVRRPELEPD